MESYNTNGRVYRCGGYNDTGYSYPTSFRGNGNSSGSGNDMGFRPTLFLKS